jgi:TfoX/Sxy family transcriptional regulator of competence genes
LAWRKSPQELIDLFGDVIPADRRIERRKMFGYPAAFVDGKLFAGLHQESFILKLPQADREKLRADHGARAFEPRPGRPMREYVVLPQALLSNRKALGRWLGRSIAYTAGLGDKAAKPRKKTAPTRKPSRAR